jgi:NADH-ubiquinone oxidoreductase chain 5
MALPLMFLALGSIFWGFLSKDLIIGLGSTTLSDSIFISFNNLVMIDAEFAPS